MVTSARAWHPWELLTPLPGVPPVWASQGNEMGRAKWVQAPGVPEVILCGLAACSSLGLCFGGTLTFWEFSVGQQHPQAPGMVHPYFCSPPSPTEAQNQGHPPPILQINTSGRGMKSSSNTHTPSFSSHQPAPSAGPALLGRRGCCTQPETDHPSSHTGTGRAGTGAARRRAAITRGCCRSMGALT